MTVNVEIVKRLGYNGKVMDISHIGSKPRKLPKEKIGELYRL
jgi:hypothetical protein